jgi:uncharacterized membrane protein YkoI
MQSPAPRTTEKNSCRTKITLPQAVAAARKAQSGKLGQVDLEEYGGRIVYMVDIGRSEVRVLPGYGYRGK